MDEHVLELYPQAGKRHDLKGLYLEKLPDRGASGAPFIYTNYIASLDGRIALPVAGQDTRLVPEAIANQRDWRLFQELAAQADLLITTGRYFRQAAKQQAQAELPLGSSATFDDLRKWRKIQGISAQPDIAIFSASLDIPTSALERYRDRKLYIVTGARTDPDKLQRLTDAAPVQIIRCGDGRHVDASQLRGQLGELGYRRTYAIAGPSVLHTLVKGNALDRLYLTTAHVLLGGTEFDTFASGPRLEPPRAMPLKRLYLDTSCPEGAGQTMAIYDT